MRSLSSSRLAPGLGLAYVVLVAINIVGFGGGNPPDPAATAEQIRATYAAHHIGYTLGPVLDGLGSILLVGFFYILARRAEARWGVVAPIAIVGAILVSALDLLWAGALWTAVQLSLLNANAESVKAMVYLSQGILGVIGVPLAVTYVAIGIASVRVRSLPIWFGWTAIVIGALALTAVIATSFSTTASALAFVSYILSLVWLIAVAIYLLARPERGTTDLPAAPWP